MNNKAYHLHPTDNKKPHRLGSEFVWMDPLEWCVHDSNGNKLPISRIKASKHNFTRIRIDVWFKEGNSILHGINVGDNSTSVMVEEK